MTQTILHFVFTPSGAGHLRQALRKAGRGDHVITTVDNLSFGPIDPFDSSARAKWIENELGQSNWNVIAAKSKNVLDEARFPDHRKVVWLTRRSAMEYAGFLDWLWQLGDLPCGVIDLTEVSYHPEHGPSGPPALAISLGMLPPDIIYRDKLWDLAEPLQKTAREQYQNLWQQLCLENAPLRVIDGDKLVSAPISFFDSMLMSCVTDDWQKVLRVIGLTLVTRMDDCIIQPSQDFLVARINALVESGSLDIQGESAFEMDASKVRLPRKQ